MNNLNNMNNMKMVLYSTRLQNTYIHSTAFPQHAKQTTDAISLSPSTSFDFRDVLLALRSPASTDWLAKPFDGTHTGGIDSALLDQ